MNVEVLAVLAVAFSAATVAAIVFAVRAKRLRAGVADAEARLAEAEARVTERDSRIAAGEVHIFESEARLAALSKYETILDAEAHAARLVVEADGRAAQVVGHAEEQARHIVEAADADAARAGAEARARADELLAQAAGVRAQADVEADEVRRAAKAKLEAAAQRAEEARSEASAILDHARARAAEVGGEALEAKKHADKYAKTAEAMKNVIEGYGDRYLIPTFSVLDALADEYGFAEAGQKLKAARERTRWMVETGRAASCDYVEERRKNTAIDFVVDAFNGKIDTILAGVKRDNYGTLEQKVRDALALVNANGEAFRNARINDDYLDARLQELRWAVAVYELREKDKEEQRQLRERIREEEKARKEYDRAMKEAAKEEETLLKMRAKVQAEFDKASDEQKAKWEKQLEEVNERLRVAEEKNQRALSMAQQTKAGHVYVISNEGSFGEAVLKIGLTRRLEPLDRIRELGDASVPFEFDVHALIRSDDAPTLERELHKKFIEGQVNKVNPRKEFFRVRVDEVRAEVERMGLAATWTLAAAAREYRETLAVERAMKEKKFDMKEWSEKQVQEHDAAMTKSVAAEAEPA